jgi:Rab proteins geranylgeranyltransferase component A
MLYSKSSKPLLEAALSAFLKAADGGEVKLLYSLYYEQEATSPDGSATPPDSSLDLAFNDDILDNIEVQWKTIIGFTDEGEQARFMQFDERNAMNEDDEDNGGY